MDIKKRAIKTGVAWVILGAFLMLSNPQDLPVLLLIVPFILLFWALVSLWGLVIPFLRHSFGQRGYEGSRRLRFTICGAIVVMIIMQSLGQLTVRDFFTMMAIGAIGYLYIGRSRSSSTS